MKTLGLALAVSALALFGFGTSVALAVSGSPFSVCASSGFVEVVDSVFTFKCPGYCPVPDSCVVFTTQATSGIAQNCLCRMEAGGGYYYYYFEWYPGDPDAECEMEWFAVEEGALGTAICIELNCPGDCYSYGDLEFGREINGTITCPCN